jgi:hypothetical protein
MPTRVNEFTHHAEHRSRFEVEWPAEEVQKVVQVIAEYPQLRSRYGSLADRGGGNSRSEAAVADVLMREVPPTARGHPLK